MSSRKRPEEDQRFARVRRDPRFWEMPEREQKIRIDRRFQAMFRDERFKVKYTVDKRGRPVNHTSAEDLRRFYKVSEEEEERGSREEVEEGGGAEQPERSGLLQEGENNRILFFFSLFSSLNC